MKEVHTGRTTRAALQSATSTWQTVAKHDRPPIQIAVGHLVKEQTLDDALDEYCQLREKDKSLTASQFCDRYPSYRHSLRRLIDVQDALEHQPALEEENWPGIFTEFLGYEILHELGVGAIARVYLAAEIDLGGRLVAIKVSHQGGYEAETLGKLTHPNVVPVFSVKYEEESGMTAVCMPYHGSATLADLLEVGFADINPPTMAREILDAAREREQVADFKDFTDNQRVADPVLLRGTYVDGIAWLGLQMAEALAYTHERGILHRDLKPSNVLLTPQGVPMLLDFNLASDVETGMQRLGGTLPYMPPEQIRDVHLQPFKANSSGDPRSDIFSLGVILYELLTGKLPFGDPPTSVSPRQAAEAYLDAQLNAPRSICEVNPAVSARLADLVQCCLALDIDRRPQTATELSAELQKHFSRSRRIGRWLGRRRGLVGTLALLSMLALSLASWHFATRPPYPAREFQAGITDLSNGAHKAALAHFDRAAAVAGDEPHLLFARGVAYQRLGDHDRAVMDLERAADVLDDPIVVECCAYSEIRHLSTDSMLDARLKYVKLGQLADLRPELQLNLAFTYFYPETLRKPTFVVQRTTEALKLRPGWQPALHLRALARCQLAKDSSSSPDQRLETIQAAHADFEEALSAGPPTARLCYDAATAYLMLQETVPSERFIQLTQMAADLGASKQAIMSLGSRRPWESSAWFGEIVARCRNEGKFFDDSGHGDFFLSEPDYAIAISCLASSKTKEFSQARHPYP
jgi:serine/threonine protein kinase